MRLLETGKEEQRQPGSVGVIEEREETLRRLRRKMRIHARPAIARAASASPVVQSDTEKSAA